MGGIIILIDFRSKYGKKRVILISPSDKKTFLRELIEQTPSLIFSGNITRYY
jgi:hypothetical protein